MRRRLLILLLCTASVLMWADKTSPKTTPLREVATVEGVRENPLIGYGLVVGLNGTGDRRQTLFTTQMLANILQKWGCRSPRAASASTTLLRFS